MTAKLIQEIIEDTEKNCQEFAMELEDASYFDYKDLEGMDTAEVIEYIEEKQEIENIYTNAEVIYYNRAMEYLSKNDASLQRSMEIAAKYGYETENINSELLASLLQTREYEENFGDFMEKLEEALQEAEDDE